MCVNDSKEQFMVDLGREVWGEDRCIVCKKRKVQALFMREGIA